MSDLGMSPSDNSDLASGTPTSSPQFEKLEVQKLHMEYGMKVEAKTFYEGPTNDDYDGSINWVEHAPSPLPSAIRQRFDSVAMQIYKRVDRNKTFNNVPTYQTSYISIQSPILIAYLRSILEGSDVVFGQKHVDIWSPFQPLYFAWSDIERAYNNAQQDSDQEEYRQLEILWKFMGEELRDILERVRTLRSEGRISHDLLWTLYPQRSSVMSTANGYQQAYRVLSCGGDTLGHSDKDKTWIIRCEFMQFDGYEYGYSEVTFRMPHFYDTKPIGSLPIYPWADVRGPDTLRQRLIERGRAVLDFQGRDFKFYDGIALEPVSEEYHVNEQVPMQTRTKFNIDSRIVIDPYLYARTKESFRREIRPFGAPIKIVPPRTRPTRDRYPVLPDVSYASEARQDLEQRKRPNADQQLLNRKIIEEDDVNAFLMSPLLDGFSLNEKKWMNFLVESVKPLQLNPDAFDDLVLPAEYKALVLAFAKQQDENVEEVDDIISGKGKGLMVLLSGPPGTGKTLTAEAVADKVGRPLYHVDTHELGSKIGHLSIKLREIMNMAAEWNAIVLLDEADVFLQKRSLSDSSQNESVAVFLRELEYYKGTMFLTTNLLDNVDEAMQSRVHVHIVFQPLLAPSRLTIWTNFFKKLAAYGDSITDADIQDLAKWTLNGRQIKNAVQMASKWCSWVDKPLNVQNTENVIRLTCPKAVKTESGTANGGI